MKAKLMLIDSQCAVLVLDCGNSERNLVVVGRNRQRMRAISITCKSNLISHRSPPKPNGHKQIAPWSDDKHFPPCLHLVCIQWSTIHSSVKIRKKKQLNREIRFYALFFLDLTASINILHGRVSDCVFDTSGVSVCVLWHNFVIQEL